MILIDCFPFFNELDVLEMRLTNLDKEVDFFVLVEMEETHAGKPKPLYYQENKERFSKWNDRIRHVVVPAMPKDTEIWQREKYQRDCIMKGIPSHIWGDATVMISDVDEIPNLEAFAFPYGGVMEKTYSLHMDMFEYSFDYMYTGEPWVGTVITSLDNLKRLGPNYFRDNRWRFPCIRNAGWHCSSFGDAAHVWNKIQNYAHAHDEKHKHQTFEDFKMYLEQGLHSDGTTKLIKTTHMTLPRGSSIFTASRGWPAAPTAL